MFNGKRDYILQPLRIKRVIDGNYITLDVIETSYDTQTGFVLLFDGDNIEFYGAYFMNQQFINIHKIPFDGEEKTQ